MTTTIKSRAAMAVLLLGVAAVAPAAPAMARHPAAAFTVGRMPLDRALDRIAAIGKVKIAFDPATVRRFTSAAVAAGSVNEAVQQAIAPSGLAMVRRADGSVAVGESPADHPDDIIVRATRNEAETGYAVQSISSATRDGKDLRSQPQSTTVITAKAIADQQIQTITQALRNASDTTVSGGVQGTPSYTVRGFDATATTGGLSDPSGNGVAIANIERIEG